MRIRIFSQRWKRFSRGNPCFSLQEFHRIHKLTLMAHGQQSARNLGRIVAGAAEGSRQNYEELFNHLVKEVSPTRGKKTNVAYHMLGYVKNQLSSQEKQTLLESINQFQAGERSHKFLLRRIRNQFVRYPDPWIAEQTYWLDSGVSPPE